YTVGGATFPNGNLEIANYYANSWFARAQAALRVWRDVRFLAGAEDTLLVFAPDKRHLSNVDLDQGGTYLPFPDDQLHPLRDVYQPVVHRPIDSIAGFAQLSSGNMLDRTLAVTAGLRYDLEFFRFADLTAPGQPERAKSFSQWSPRAGLVVFATPAPTVKAPA